MKRMLIAGWLFMAWGHLCAQAIVVKDRETGKPLESVVMTGKGQGGFAVTDTRGAADISALRGADSIVLRHLGYRTALVSYRELQSAGSVFYMTPSDITLDDLVISATKWRQPAEKVSYRITGVSPKQVAFQNPQTAADLLSVSGEVYIQKSQQGGGSPMIRGFSSNRLLYAVDGIRMNTAIFRSGNIQNVISLDPFAVEKAEILFGPGSVIYGSDAIGGVMAFSTPTPTLRNAKESSVSGTGILRFASANREKTGHIDLGYGRGKWAGYTSISGFYFDDLLMGRHGPERYKRNFYVQRIGGNDVIVDNAEPLLQVPTGYSQFNLLQKLRFVPDSQWDLQYGFYYSATSDFPRYDRLIQLEDSLPKSAEWRYGPQVWMMQNIFASHVHSGLYDQMNVRVAHQYFRESRMDRDFGDPWRRTRMERVHAVSANLDFIVAPVHALDVFYGVEAVSNLVHSAGEVTNVETAHAEAGPSRYPEASWSSFAAYVTLQYEFSEQLIVHTGARYSHVLLSADFSGNAEYYPLPVLETDLSTGALTGNIGLVSHPGSHWKIGVNLSTGFRAPNVDDIGKVFDSEPGAVVVPNTDLYPEYAYNAELSVNKDIGNALQVYTSVYYTLLDDAMVRKDGTLNGGDSILYDGTWSKVQAIQNAASVRIAGLQAGFEWQLPLNTSITSKINYQYGREEEKEGGYSPARHAAPLFGVTRISYRRKGFMAQVYGEYNGTVPYSNLAGEERGKPHLYAIDDDGNPYAPGWFTLNVKASYRLKKHYLFTAGIENITDRRYRTYSSGIASPGRNFMAGISMSF